MLVALFKVGCILTFMLSVYGLSVVINAVFWPGRKEVRAKEADVEYLQLEGVQTEKVA